MTRGRWGKAISDFYEKGGLWGQKKLYFFPKKSGKFVSLLFPKREPLRGLSNWSFNKSERG